MANAAVHGPAARCTAVGDGRGKGWGKRGAGKDERRGGCGGAAAAQRASRAAPSDQGPRGAVRGTDAPEAAGSTRVR